MPLNRLNQGTVVEMNVAEWVSMNVYFRRVEKLKKMLDLVTRAGRNPDWDDIFELYSDEEILTASNQMLRGAIPFDWEARQ